MEKKVKACMECGEELIGRADKKFCNDMCRNSYNNRLNSDNNIVERNINNILRRNRRILQDLNTNEKTKVHRNKLLEKGFHFGYITSIYKTKKGDTYFFCYDQGYLPIEDGYFVLVLNKKEN